ncbi:MAG: prepilin peptidase [Brotaphodocola sp.]
MRECFFYLAANVIAAFGAFTDLKYHKIYNKLTFPSMAAGLAFRLIFFGISGLKISLFGILMGTVFGIFWILGMLKAGDIKLYMALGAFGGWRFCGYTMIYSVLTGGIVALCLMVIRKSGRESLERLKIYILHLFYTKRFMTYKPVSEKGYFSFGCCIFVGSVMAAWYLWIQ